MGMGSYGRGGGMPSYQQGPSFGGKGGSRPMGQPSPYGASPYGGGMGGSRQMPMMGQPGFGGVGSFFGGGRGPVQRELPPDFGKLGSALGGAFVPGGQVAPQVQNSNPQQNPFAENAEYQALQEFQKSLAPTEEQQARLQELRSAFEGTDAYRNQLQEQQRLDAQRVAQMQARQQAMSRMRSPYMMGGIGGFRNQYGPPMQREFGGFRPMQYMYKEGGSVSN